MSGAAVRPELAVVIPALDEGDNLALLLPGLAATLERLGVPAEVVVVDGGSTDDTAAVATALGVRVVAQLERGYGGALLAGFAATSAPFVATLDADLSHPPAFLAELWARRGEAEVVIASRWAAGGGARMGRARELASRALNRVFRRVLSLPVHDLSSGFRLYHRHVVARLPLVARDFDALEEILIRVYNRGFAVAEVPFTYEPRRHGVSHARVARLALAFLRTGARMWRLRNAASAADYDARAFDSPIPLQRYWQRARHRIVLSFVAGRGAVLDAGCGSSRIIQDLGDAVGLDLSTAKLRFLAPRHRLLVRGDTARLPFRTGAFAAVISSEVIEHIPDTDELWAELDRVLAPGGVLVVGTPDYARPLWHVIEWAYGLLLPQAYAGEHITHYTRRSLEARLAALGYAIEARRTVGWCELIYKARKPG